MAPESPTSHSFTEPLGGGRRRGQVWPPSPVMLVGAVGPRLKSTHWSLPVTHLPRAGWRWAEGGRAHSPPFLWQRQGKLCLERGPAKDTETQTDRNEPSSTISLRGEDGELTRHTLHLGICHLQPIHPPGALLPDSHPAGVGSCPPRPHPPLGSFHKKTIGGYEEGPKGSMRDKGARRVGWGGSGKGTAEGRGRNAPVSDGVCGARPVNA